MTRYSVYKKWVEDKTKNDILWSYATQETKFSYFRLKELWNEIDREMFVLQKDQRLEGKLYTQLRNRKIKLQDLIFKMEYSLAELAELSESSKKLDELWS